MSDRLGCAALVVVTIILSSCATAAIPNSSVPRQLTILEMDLVSAGSATAISNVDASAFGAAPRTSTSTDTLVSSGGPASAPPFIGLPTLDYAVSEGTASANNGLVTQVNGSTHIGVMGGGGGASIDAFGAAAASGNPGGQAQLSMQFYGLSISRVDLAFGSVMATACCAPSLRAQSSADAAGGGNWRELQAFTQSDVSGQLQSRIDISVVSSAFPLLDPGQVSAFVAPNLSQSISQ
jgi:hypothetical protein